MGIWDGANEERTWGIQAVEHFFCFGSIHFKYSENSCSFDDASEWIANLPAKKIRLNTFV